MSAGPADMEHGERRPPERPDMPTQFTAFDAPPDDHHGITNFLPSQPGLDLPRFGLPPRPDADRQPLLRKVWDRVLDRRVKLLPFTPDLSLLGKVNYRIMRRKMAVLSPAQAQAETSSNWSGAYITSNGGKRFMLVWGLWRTPDVLSIPPPPLQGQPGIDFVVANWIGLDGQRRYFDSSLPQIGTSSVLLPDGKVRVDPWLQWWARDDPDPKVTPISIPIEAGDLVACALLAYDPHTVWCLIANLNPARPHLRTISGIAPTIPLGGVPSISGATAEWVVERPTVLGSDKPNNLPDYGETGFELCVAAEGKHPDIGSLFDGTLQTQDLAGARTIRMFDTLTGPARTVFTSMPRKVDDLTLRVRYGGFE
ncbi:MAG TPA: G1 family glutamic endopeptidase [Acetobacteraceae bacterium]